MEKTIEKGSLFYATALFNESGTEVTITLGSTEPKVCKSKLGAALHLESYVNGLIKSLPQEQLRDANASMLQEVSNAIDTAPNLPMDTKEDLELCKKRIGSMFGSPMFTMIVTVVEKQQAGPMEDPEFKVCPHCGESGEFVDRKNPRKKSPIFYSKEDALDWLKQNVESKRLTKEQGENLAHSVWASDLSPTTAEFLVKQQQAEPCREN